eukprot:scaffold59863_cov69-Phaeocystis_antarctica.AAC.1
MPVELLFDSADPGHCLHAPADVWLMSGWKVLTPHGIARPAEHQEPFGQASQSLALVSGRGGATGGAPGSYGARLARLLALLALKAACSTPVARTHLGVGRDRAGAARRLVGAARGCEVARTSRRALLGAAEVSDARVRALAARQRRRRALRAVRARHTHVALGPAGLVHKLACAALVTLGLLAQRLHGTRAARRWIGAARGCVRAWHGWRAIASGAKIGLVGVCALVARQCSACALRAVTPGLAGDARLLALVGLVLAGRTLVARAHSRHGLDRAGAASSLLGAARRRGRCAGARWAVRAALAGNASLLALTLLVLAGRALDARAHARVGRDGAGAARRLHGATGWRVVALGSRRAFRVSCEVGGVGVRALLARQRRAGALWAVRAGLAGDARLLALTRLELAGLAPVARNHFCIGRDGAGAALGLLPAARRRKVARVGSRALCSGAKIGLVGVCALVARQRRTGASRAVRAGLAGNARLLALAGLVRTGGASVTKVSARAVRNEAGRAVSTVGWFRAPRDRVGLPRGARLARRAAILANIWVERASRARRERLPQARCPCRRAVATTGAVAARDRADVLAQRAHRARQAVCASLVRVVGTGRARNAACLHQAGDPDGEVCSGRA